MIAACPKCGARYRIDPARLRADGVRLRCSKCEAIFRITPPRAQAEAAAAQRPPAPVQQPDGGGPHSARLGLAARPPGGGLAGGGPHSARVPLAARPPGGGLAASAAASASAAAPRSEKERRNLVLVADTEVEAGKALANTLAGWGLEPVLVHDGVEAILTIQRILPRAVILDAGLPKMFGFQICELMKRNESLRWIHVVLVGAVHHQDRYRRAPSQLYGADAYVERPQLPEALQTILRGFGLDVGDAVPPPPPVPEPAVPPPARAVPEAPVSPPASARPRPGGAAPDPAVADAERLARIIVSDIVLYNPEKFEAGIRDGNVLEVLGGEIEEGRGHFEQRVEPRVRQSRDFLAEELIRVARLRGMK